MKINQNIFPDKNPRPKSSKLVHDLPKIPLKNNNKKEYPIISISDRELNFDFNVTSIPKIEAEKVYKENLDLKETIKELKKNIEFYKTNNQKLSQSISKKNKEINELTNQIILKNKELMTKEKKEKENKEQNSTKNISNENIFEEKIKIKKLNNEVNIVKEEMQRLKLTLLQKEEELFNIKKSKTYTDYRELQIKYETLLEEFNKLRNMKLINSDKNYLVCLDNEKNLNLEIFKLKEIISALNQERDKYYLEKKSLNDEINDLKNKLDLARGNSKLIKNKMQTYEQKYKKKIKEQVIQKEYEEEKKEMIDKINKLQKKLDYYMLNAVKNKEYQINNNKLTKEENKNNNLINNEIRRNIINVKNIKNPEENFDNKILLMQSLITELTKENKELLEKNQNYEIKINSLLQTNREILNSNMGLDNLFLDNNIQNNKNKPQLEKEAKEQKNRDETESISKDEDD